LIPCVRGNALRHSVLACILDIEANALIGADVGSDILAVIHMHASTHHSQLSGI
jgi:hypothetical protein